MGAMFYAVLLVLFVVILGCFSGWLAAERFNVPKDAASEFIPPNMSFTEYKTINRWDYPGYLESGSDLKREFNPVLVKPTLTTERFDSIYPGGREDVNCVDADYMGAGGQCDIMGPYIQDPRLHV